MYKYILIISLKYLTKNITPILKKKRINLMTEISKRMKLLLIIDTICAFIYGFLYLVIPEILAALNDPTYYDPHFWRLWGGLCIVFGIFGILMIKRAEWEGMKILWEFVIIWLIMMILVNIMTMFMIRRSAVNFASELFDIILISVLIVVNTYLYLQEGQ